MSIQEIWVLVLPMTKENKETNIVISIVVPTELVKEIDRLAKENHRSRSGQVVYMLVQALKNNSKGGSKE